MPIYEYKCGKCGAISEFIVFGKEENLSCKSCGDTNLEKLISAHNTVGSDNRHSESMPTSCCGSPNSCGMPGSCCSN